MNQPLKKYYDQTGKKQYTGNVIPLFPNRKTRRLAFQKSENNPLHGVSFHQHATISNEPGVRALVYKLYVQKVWNKIKEKFVTIIHTRYI